MTMNKNKPEIWTLLLFVVMLIVSPFAANKIDGVDGCKQFVIEHKEKAETLRNVDADKILCTEINHDGENVFEVDADQAKYVLYQNLKNEDNKKKSEYFIQSGLGVNFQLIDTEDEYNTYLANVSGYELIKLDDWKLKTSELEKIMTSIMKKTEETKDDVEYHFPTQFSSAYYNSTTGDIQFFQMWSFESSDSYIDVNNFLEAFISQFEIEDDNEDVELVTKIQQIKDKIFQGIKRDNMPAVLKDNKIVGDAQNIENAINQHADLQHLVNDDKKIGEPQFAAPLTNEHHLQPNLLNVANAHSKLQLDGQPSIVDKDLNLDELKKLYRLQNKKNLLDVQKPQQQQVMHADLNKDLKLNHPKLQLDVEDPDKYTLVPVDERLQGDAKNGSPLKVDQEHLKKLLESVNKNKLDEYLSSQQKYMLNRDKKGNQHINFGKGGQVLALPPNEKAIDGTLAKKKKFESHMQIGDIQENLMQRKDQINRNHERLKLDMDERALNLKNPERRVRSSINGKIGGLMINSENGNVGQDVELYDPQKIQDIDLYELKRDEVSQSNHPKSIKGAETNQLLPIQGVASNQQELIEGPRSEQNSEMIETDTRSKSPITSSTQSASPSKKNDDTFGKGSSTPKKVEARKASSPNKPSYAIILVVSVIVLAILSIFCIVILDKRISRVHDIEQGVNA